VKYFFLSDGWTTGRIWEFGGLWDEFAWQRKPHIQRLNLCVQENGETLWLYQVEEAVLMVEVRPEAISDRPIGQVVLKRLITGDQVIQHLCEDADAVVLTARLNGLAANSEAEAASR
jgi:hypothetical protein